MKKLFAKLKSDLGETLVEAMASLLIFTLASIGLFSMISSSARINKQADDASTKHYEQMMVAEGAEGVPDKTGQSVKIEFTPAEGSGLSQKTVITFVDVDVYQSDDGDDALYAYYKHVDGGGT